MAKGRVADFLYNFIVHVYGHFAQSFSPEYGLLFD
jgi:hypothetical protein